MDDFTHTFSGIVHFSYTYNINYTHANVQKKARNSKVGSFFGTSWTRFGRIYGKYKTFFVRSRKS